MKKILIASLIAAGFVSCKKSSQSPPASSNTLTGKYAESKVIDTNYQANGSSTIVDEPFLPDTLNFTTTTSGLETGSHTTTFTYSRSTYSFNDGNEWTFIIVSPDVVELYYKGDLQGSGGLNTGLYYQKIN
jgi:hypothetical protein